MMAADKYSSFYSEQIQGTDWAALCNIARWNIVGKPITALVSSKAGNTSSSFGRRALVANSRQNVKACISSAIRPAGDYSHLHNLSPVRNLFPHQL